MTDVIIQLAQRGDAEAQNELGVFYKKGIGVPQDYNEAFKWFTKAAEQGEPMAQANLGDCYAFGHGVPQNSSEAVKWHTKAAEQGDTGAQYNLAISYAQGIGVARDYNEAVKWFAKAAAQGLVEAQQNLESLAKQGLAGAQFNLGVCYDKGSGFPQDDDKAVEWYTKAAEQGHVEAQSRLKALTVVVQDGMEETQSTIIPKMLTNAILKKEKDDLEKKIIEIERQKEKLEQDKSCAIDEMVNKQKFHESLKTVESRSGRKNKLEREMQAARTRLANGFNVDSPSEVKRMQQDYEMLAYENDLDFLLDRQERDAYNEFNTALERIKNIDNNIEKINLNLAAHKTQLSDIKATLQKTPEQRVEEYYRQLLAEKEKITINEESLFDIVQKFRELEGYKDTGAIAAECEKKAFKLKYKRLIDTMGNASHEEEYLNLAKQFRDMNGYEDTNDLASQCESEYRKLKEHRETLKRKNRSTFLVMTGLAAISFISLIVGDFGMGIGSTIFIYTLILLTYFIRSIGWRIGCSMTILLIFVFAGLPKIDFSGDVSVGKIVASVMSITFYLASYTVAWIYPKIKINQGIPSAKKPVANENSL